MAEPFFFSPSHSINRLKLKWATGTCQWLPNLQCIFYGEAKPISRSELKPQLLQTSAQFQGKCRCTGRESACYHDGGLEASRDAVASPGMLLLPLQKAWGNLTPCSVMLLGHPVQTCLFSSISQSSDEKMYFFPKAPTSKADTSPSHAGSSPIEMPPLLQNQHPCPRLALELLD